MNEKLFVGIDLGGTNIKAGLVDAQGQVKIEKEIATEVHGGVDHVMGRMRDLILQLRDEANGPVPGVGVGLPGMVNVDDGIFHEGPNLPGWIDEPLVEKLGAMVKMPVILDNDANVAALGEFAFGAGRGVRDMLMVTLGTGVGGGLILNGELFYGCRYSAGEFGHTIINFEGPTCGCGRPGCIEAYIGTAGILNRVQEKINAGAISILSEIEASKMTPKDISDAAEKGDDVAIEVLSDTGRYLGIATANVANLLNIQRVVVGGGVAKAGDWILNSAKATLKEVALKVPSKCIDMVPAVLGNQAGLIGAARLAMLKTQ